MDVILTRLARETTRDIPVPEEIETTTIQEDEDEAGEYDYPTIVDNDAEFRKRCQMKSKYFLSYC